MAAGMPKTHRSSSLSCIKKKEEKYGSAVAIGAPHVAPDVPRKNAGLEVVYCIFSRACGTTQKGGVKR